MILPFKYETIPLLLAFIKDHVGLELTPCEHFVGVREHNDVPYFNVELGVSTSESPAYTTLERLAKESKIIVGVEPNGYSRVAISFNPEFELEVSHED